ncbi:MAG: YjjG family noncanonical pyrimidine nucleotidase [Cytophagales bacterium]|nr:YjjG family noncanonical pyrimidine nucleotidase [Cytophagales bacterium]
MPVKTIFFDLDHTLWDYDTNARETLFEIYDDFRLDRGFSSAEEFFQTYLVHNEKLWHLYNHGKIGRDDIRERRFYQVISDVGLDDKKMAEQMSDQFMEVCPHKTAVMPGTYEIMEHLKPVYQMGIITNGFSDTQAIKMAKTGLDKYFEIMVTSESAKARKPSAEIFNTALTEARAQAAHVVMIGDNRATDIGGALTLGWKTIWYTKEEEEAPENCWKVKHLEEIAQVMEEL